MSNAQTSYTWDGSSSSDWNTAANWTPSGVPGSADHVTINNAGLANQPVLDTDRSITNINVSAGTLDLDGHDLTITGATTLSGGVINNGKTIFNNTTTAFAGTAFGAKVTVNASNVTFAGTTFSEIVTVVKTGSSTNTSSGGNTFNDTLDITLNAGSITLYATNDDNFNGHVFVAHTGTGTISFGDGSNTGTLASGKTISVGTNGFDNGQLQLRKFIQTGSTPQNLIDIGYLRIREYSVFNGRLTIDVDSIDLGLSTFNKRVNVTRHGAGTSALQGGNTFNDTLDINLAEGNMTFSNMDDDVFNGDVYVSNTVPIFSAYFGVLSIGGGSRSTTPVLSSGYKIKLGSGGFAKGVLSLVHLTQNGSTTQSLTLTGTALLQISACTFNGALTYSSPKIEVSGSTFNSSATFTKTGSSTNYWDGGNTYNGAFTLNNSSSAYIHLADNYSDVYNSTADFNRTSTGDIVISVDGNSSFYNDVNISSGVASNFGTGSGRIYFKGTASGVTLSKTGAGNINISRLTIDKSSNHLTLSDPVYISNNVTFTSGKIITTSTNILELADGATVTSASNSSFVDGPINKVGNDAFVFPVGKSSSYRPIGISAPASSASEFTAEYIATGQSLGSTLDTGYVSLSNCEYWTLTRAGSSSNVNVSLSWNGSSCNVSSPGMQVVTGWAAGKWRNYGNGAYTGNSASGTVTASDTAGVYHAFALGLDSCDLVIDAGPDIVSYHGAQVQLGGSPTASGGVPPYTYNWSTGATTANPFYTINGEEDIILEVTDSLGCTRYDTLSIDTLMPEIIVTPLCDSAITICIDSAAFWAGNYFVIDGATFTNCDTIYIDSATVCITCTIDSIYGPIWVHFQDSTTNIDIVDSIQATPLIVDAGPDIAAYYNQYIQIGGSPSATGGHPPYTYSWSNGKITANPFWYATIQGNIILTVTDSLGCIGYDTMYVDTVPPPDIDVIIHCDSAITICIDSAEFWVGSYFYMDGATFTNCDTVYVDSSMTCFTCTIDSIWGSITVHLNDPYDNQIITPIAVTPLVVDAGPDIVSYHGAQVQLGGSPTASGGAPSYSYSWSTGATIANPFYTVNGEEDIIVEVTDSVGCVGYDTLHIDTIAPIIIITPPNCSDSTITICIDSADFWAGNYFYIDGATFTDCDTMYVDSSTVCITCTIDSLYGPITIHFNDSISGNGIITPIALNNFNWPPALYFSNNYTACYDSLVNFNFSILYEDITGANSISIDWGHLDSLGSPVITSGPLVSTSFNHHFPGPGTYNLIITTSNDSCDSTNVYEIDYTIQDLSMQVNITNDTLCSNVLYYFTSNFTCLENGMYNLHYVFGDGDTAVMSYWHGAYGTTYTHTYLISDTTLTFVGYVTSMYDTVVIVSDTVEIFIHPPLNVNAGMDTLTGMPGDWVTLGGSPTVSDGLGPYYYTWLSNGSNFSNASNPSTTIQSYWDDNIIIHVSDQRGCSGSDTIILNLNIPEFTVDFSGCTDSTLTICLDSAELWVGYTINIVGAYMTDCENQILIDSTTTCIECKVDRLTSIPSVSIHNPMGAQISPTITATGFNWPAVIGLNTYYLICDSNLSQTVYIGYLDTSAGNTYQIDWGYPDSLGAPVTTFDTITSMYLPFLHTFPGEGTYHVTISTINSECSDTAEYTTDIVLTDGIYLSAMYDSTCAPVNTYLYADFNCFNYGGHSFDDYRIIWDLGDGRIDSALSYMSNNRYAMYYAEGAYTVTAYVVLASDPSTVIDSASTVVIVLPGPDADAGLDTIFGIPGDIITLGGSPSGSGGEAPYSYNWYTTDYTGVAGNESNPTVEINYKWEDGIVLEVTDNKGCKGYDTIVLSLTKPEFTVDFSGCEDSTLTICITNPEYFVGSMFSLSGVSYNYDGELVIDSATSCVDIHVDQVYGKIGVYVMSSSYNMISDAVVPENYDWPPMLNFYSGPESIIVHLCYNEDSTYFPLYQYIAYYNADSGAVNTMTIDWGFTDSLGNPVVYNGPFDPNIQPAAHFPGVGEYNFTITTHIAACPDSNVYHGIFNVVDGVRISSSPWSSCDPYQYNFSADFACLESPPWGNMLYTWYFGDDSTVSNTWANWIQYTYQDTGSFTVIFTLTNTLDSSLISADTMTIHIGLPVVANAGLDTISGYGGVAITLGGSPASTGGVPPISYRWYTYPNDGDGEAFSYIANPQFVPTPDIEYIILYAYNNYRGCGDYDTIVVDLIAPELSVSFSGCTDSTLHICIDNAEQFAGHYFNILGATLQDTTNNILITDTTTCIDVKVDSIYGQFGVAVYSSVTNLPMSDIIEPDPFPWPIVAWFTDQNYTCFGTTNYLNTHTNPILWDTSGFHYVTVDWGYLDSLGSPVIWADTVTGSNAPSTLYPAPGIYNVTITTNYSGCPGEFIVSGPIRVIDGLSLVLVDANRCSQSIGLRFDDDCFDNFYENHPEFDPELIHNDEYSFVYVFGDGDTLINANDGVVYHTYDTAGTYQVYMHLYNDGVLITTDSMVVNIGNGINLTATPDTAIIIVGDSIQLNASASGGVGPYAYEWTPVEGLSNPLIYNPYAHPDTVTNYYVTAYDSKGCFSQAVRSVIKPIRTSIPGLSVETSGCPGSMIEICIDNPEDMAGMEIHIDGYILADGCDNVTVITSGTTCINCQIISVYGIPSISVVDPATGLVYNDLIIIQSNY